MKKLSLARLHSPLALQLEFTFRICGTQRSWPEIGNVLINYGVRGSKKHLCAFALSGKVNIVNLTGVTFRHWFRPPALRQIYIVYHLDLEALKFRTSKTKTKWQGSQAFPNLLYRSDRRWPPFSDFSRRRTWRWARFLYVPTTVSVFNIRAPVALTQLW